MAGPLVSGAVVTRAVVTGCGAAGRVIGRPVTLPGAVSRLAGRAPRPLPAPRIRGRRAPAGALPAAGRPAPLGPALPFRPTVRSRPARTSGPTVSSRPPAARFARTTLTRRGGTTPPLAAGSTGTASATTPLACASGTPGGLRTSGALAGTSLPGRTAGAPGALPCGGTTTTSPRRRGASRRGASPTVRTPDEPRPARIASGDPTGAPCIATGIPPGRAGRGRPTPGTRRVTAALGAPRTATAGGSTAGPGRRLGPRRLVVRHNRQHSLRSGAPERGLPRWI